VAKGAIAIDLDDVYELPPVDASGEIPDEWQTTATYNLEMAVRCPHCDDAIRTIRIVGMSRSQVAFTSTLSRKEKIMTVRPIIMAMAAASAATVTALRWIDCRR